MRTFPTNQVDKTNHEKVKQMTTVLKHIKSDKTKSDNPNQQMKRQMTFK